MIPVSEKRHIKWFQLSLRWLPPKQFIEMVSQTEKYVTRLRHEIRRIPVVNIFRLPQTEIHGKKWNENNQEIVWWNKWSASIGCVRWAWHLISHFGVSCMAMHRVQLHFLFAFHALANEFHIFLLLRLLLRLLVVLHHSHNEFRNKSQGLRVPFCAQHKFQFTILHTRTGCVLVYGRQAINIINMFRVSLQRKWNDIFNATMAV